MKISLIKFNLITYTFCSVRIIIQKDKIIALLSHDCYY